MIKEDVIHCKELIPSKIRGNVEFIMDASGTVTFKDVEGFTLAIFKRVGNKIELHMNGRKVLG